LSISSEKEVILMDGVTQESTEMIILGNRSVDPDDTASEITRLNERIDQLEKMLEQLSDTSDRKSEIERHDRFDGLGEGMIKLFVPC
jgi:hypothetical protein